MAQDLVGIREAVRGWHVSERALRRRLSSDTPTGAQRADDGSWLVPSDWLDVQFDRSVIDLRDPAVSDGLAAILTELSNMTEQVQQAEVRAALAESERTTLAARLRTATDDLEHERAERQRLAHDYAELQRDFAVQAERLTRAEAEVERAWDTWQRSDNAAAEAQTVAEKEVQRLSREASRAQQKLSLVEGMLGRRKRRVYDNLAQGIDQASSLR